MPSKRFKVLLQYTRRGSISMNGSWLLLTCVGVKQRRGFELHGKPECTGKKCVVEMMTCARWPFGLGVHYVGLSCAIEEEILNNTGGIVLG